MTLCLLICQFCLVDFFFVVGRFGNTHMTGTQWTSNEMGLKQLYANIFGASETANPIHVMQWWIADNVDTQTLNESHSRTFPMSICVCECNNCCGTHSMFNVLRQWCAYPCNKKSLNVLGVCTCLAYMCVVRELKSFAFGLCRLIDVDENRIARCTHLDQRRCMNIRYKLYKAM